MEALFRDEREKTTALLASGPHGHAVGAFEGAMYEGRGYYRPQADCIMFTRDEVGFCAGGPSSGLSIFTRGLHLDEKHFHRARAQVTDGACVAIKPAGLAAFHAHILSASVETLEAQVALVDAHGERIHVVVHVHGLVRLQRELDGAHVRIFEIQVVMRRIDRQRVAAIEPPLWNNVRRKPLLPVRAQSQHCKEEETHARSYHRGRATPRFGLGGSAEESASASKELDAQAGAMRHVANQLRELVQGA